MGTDIFNHERADRAAFERMMRRPAPARRYVIHFTPRSGSSWLTALAEASGVLGSPVECFNRDFMPEMVRALGAVSMAEYVDAIGRRFQARGTAGLEVTQYQMHWAFGSESAFQTHFRNARPIWLFRQDIVAAAVSLEKMQAVGVSHSVNATPEARAEAEAGWRYDDAAIAEWLDHIRVLEERSLAYFRRFGLTPLVLSYETMMDAGGARVLARICRHLDLPEGPFQSSASPHEKVGTGRNAEYAERFRKEYRRLDRRLAKARAALVASAEPL
jgi:LPS sulfotransferase NodH